MHNTFDQNIKIFNLIGDENSSDLLKVVSDIMGWLKFEHKRNNWLKQGKSVVHKPLLLKTETLNLAIRLVNQCETMSNCFEIKDNKLDFKNTINEEEINIIREEIFNNYLKERHSLTRDNVN